MVAEVVHEPVTKGVRQRRIDILKRDAVAERFLLVDLRPVRGHVHVKRTEHSVKHRVLIRGLHDFQRSFIQLTGGGTIERLQVTGETTRGG